MHAVLSDAGTFLLGRQICIFPPPPPKLCWPLSIHGKERHVLPSAGKVPSQRWTQCLATRSTGLLFASSHTTRYTMQDTRDGGDETVLNDTCGTEKYKPSRPLLMVGEFFLAKIGVSATWEPFLSREKCFFGLQFLKDYFPDVSRGSKRTSPFPHPWISESLDIRYSAQHG